MVAALGLWSAALVAFRFDGNATGLFCFGALSKAARIDSRTPLWLNPASFGYDGQFYYLLARDPLLGTHTVEHLDDARVRSRRVLLPAAAHTLALGYAPAIAYTYWALVIASAGLGTWWLSRLAAARGLPEFHGAIFTLAPAVLVGIERMTVDGVLATAIAGLCYFQQTGRPRPVLAILTAAPLIRETGILLTAATAFVEWRERGPRRALAIVSTAVPFAAWSIYVTTRTAPDHVTWFGPPAAGVAQRLISPTAYPFPAWLSGPLVLLDYLALGGVVLAIGLSLWRARHPSIPTVSAALFAVLALGISNADVWAEIYGFGRTMSPVLLLTAIGALQGGPRWLIVPMLLVVPRVATQMAAPFLRPLIGL